MTDRRLVLATTGDRVSVSADGLTQVFEARDVRDFTVTAATDFRTASRVGWRHDRSGLVPAGDGWCGAARCGGGRVRGA